MALYAIGDTHLSLSSDKPMDVFGGVWQGYLDKLAEGFSILRPEDTLVIPGDISWGMSLEQAEADFAWLDAWPGTKILLKGNHDYWWNSMAKMTRFFEEKGFTSLKILHNTCYFYGNVALCGSRGWFFEEEGPDKAQNEKILNREVGRLETSLKAAGDKEKLCFLHYPVRRDHLLLWPPPREKPAPSGAEHLERRGLPAGLGGLSQLPTGKNLRLKKKRLVIRIRI